MKTKGAPLETLNMFKKSHSSSQHAAQNKQKTKAAGGSKKFNADFYVVCATRLDLAVLFVAAAAGEPIEAICYPFVRT